MVVVAVDRSGRVVVAGRVEAARLEGENHQSVIGNQPGGRGIPKKHYKSLW